MEKTVCLILSNYNIAIISGMPNVRELFNQAKRRVKPEGLAIGTVLTGTSILVIPTLQTALTFVISEASKNIPTDTIELAAIGILALANAASIAVESRTLKKEQYSASPIASTLNVLSGKPIISSALGHGINFMQSYGLNPVNIISVGSLIAGDQGRLFAENAMGVSLSLGLWNIGFNTLILMGKIEPVVKGIKKVRHGISGLLKKPL